MRLEEFLMDVTEDLPPEEKEKYIMKGYRRLFVERLEILDMYLSKIEKEIGEDTGDYLEVVGNFRYFKPQGIAYTNIDPFNTSITYSPWEPASVQEMKSKYTVFSDFTEDVFNQENSYALLLATLSEDSSKNTIQPMEDNGWIIKNPIFKFEPSVDNLGNQFMILSLQGFSSISLPTNSKIAFNVDFSYQ